MRHAPCGYCPPIPTAEGPLGRNSFIINKKEFHVNTIYFTEPTTENIAAAADIIRRGGLLGIPTETVY